MEQINPKYEIGTKIIYKQKKYTIADHVYYKNTNSWYYWLRGITKKSRSRISEWIYTNDAKQLLIRHVDDDISIKVIEKVG